MLDRTGPMAKRDVIPEAAMRQHMAILGKTGSGKSYAARGIVEGLLDGPITLALQPE